MSAKGDSARPGPLHQGHFVPLLVEDEPDFAELLGQAFVKAGVPGELLVVGSGEEAIEVLSGGRAGKGHARLPTLILLDSRLPGTSGLDVLSWIRKHPRWARTPVVILTSTTEQEHVNRAYLLGVNSYLVKPTSFEALVELARSLWLLWGRLNVGPERGPPASTPPRAR